MKAQTGNLPASVRQRLLTLAKARQEDFQRVLVQYALERLLYRLSQSPYADRFILKGALLFTLWMAEPHRRTRDLDLLGSGDGSPEHLTLLFQELCTLPVEADGLAFDADSVTARPIREENIYGGVRVTLKAFLGAARISLQIDVGFGDAVTPGPAVIRFPTLLDFPAPSLRVYAQETVIAEKLSALVALGMDNSRMKDFFDLWTLAQHFPFEGERLGEAIRATFARREMSLPVGTPVGLSKVFSSHTAKQTQWRAFLQQSVSPSRQALTLDTAIGFVGTFLLPILNTLSTEETWTGVWPPGGPWQK
jgi:hypothetical protein